MQSRSRSAAPSEVTGFRTERVAPDDAEAYNPAFDVTPGHLITAFVTEYGILRPPYAESIPDLEFRPNVTCHRELVEG